MFTHDLVFDLQPETHLLVCRRRRLGDRALLHRLRAVGNGVTSVMYEGTPDYPNKDRWWSMIEKYRVTVLYCAPPGSGRS